MKTFVRSGVQYLRNIFYFKNSFNCTVYFLYFIVVTFTLWLLFLYMFCIYFVYVFVLLLYVKLTKIDTNLYYGYVVVLCLWANLKIKLIAGLVKIFLSLGWLVSITYRLAFPEYVKSNEATSHGVPLHLWRTDIHSCFQSI